MRAKVGDRYVLEELLARGWQLGGEGSGHLLALDRHTTGDGIVSALQVLQAVVRAGRPLAELLAGVDAVPAGADQRRASSPATTGRRTARWPTRAAEVERELGATRAAC